jgi:hypothetical protein
LKLRKTAVKLEMSNNSTAAQRSIKTVAETYFGHGLKLYDLNPVQKDLHFLKQH